MLPEKINRKEIVIAQRDALYDNDVEYWKRASAEEKFETITYLRECFYGEEATSGRLQRVHSIVKLK